MSNPNEVKKRVVSNEAFRQTRFDNIDGSVSIAISGNSYSVANWSRTGIAFEVPNSQSFEIGQKVDDVVISSSDIKLFHGVLKIVSVVTTNDHGSRVGATFSSSLFMQEGVEAANSVHKTRVLLELERSRIGAVSPEVCQIVLILRAQLESLRSICDKEEARWRRMTFDQRCESESIFLPYMSKAISAALNSFNKKVSELIDVDNLKAGSEYHVLFQRELMPLFTTADLARRAYEKPRGYAGDFEMMNQIYRDGYEGLDLYGRILHHYVSTEASSESVKFRMPFFIQFFESAKKMERRMNILSVACGPAIEVQEVLKKWSQSELDKVHFTLFDLDKEALEHAQARIYESSLKLNKDISVNFINANVKTFITDRNINNSKWDLIYSGGLFDYFDNLTSAAFIRAFASMLNPGGRLVVGNFTKDNSTKAFCHLITDWNLIHKTEEEIQNWAQGVEGCSTEVLYDPGKINAFLVLTKNASDK